MVILQMNRLLDLREDRDLNQEIVGNCLGFARNTISQYETETRDISTKTYRQFSKFYNTSIDYILYRTDNRNIYNKSKVKVTDKINRLKKLRKTANKTQEQVSLDLKIHIKTYRQYEDCILDLNTNLLNIFADYYKTSVDYLICNTDDIKPYEKSKVDLSKKE